METFSPTNVWLCGLCICPHLLQEEVSLMMTEYSTDLSRAEYH